MPKVVGQAPCKEKILLDPFLWRLYQNAKDPFLGKTAVPKSGKPVAPPSTSESFKNLTQSEI